MKARVPKTDFETIHADHRGRIVGYLRRLTRDPAVAEELAQETFLRVSRGLGDFRGDARHSTWIYRIATNVYLDFHRGARARHAVMQPFPPDQRASPDQMLPDADEPRLADRLFEASEMGDCVREFIDSLPPEYQTVIVLHDLHDLKNADIAQILDCSLETVKIRIHRARQRLKALLTEHCDFEHGADNVLRCDRKQTPKGHDA